MPRPPAFEDTLLKPGRSGAGWRVLLALLVVPLVFTAVTCGKDSSTNPPAPTPNPPPVVPARPTTITLTPTTPAPLTRVGQTVQLTATVRDQNNNAMTGVSVAWKSGNPLVATVSAAGLVTAAGNGTTAITASTGAVTGTVRVTVSGLPETPASVVLTPAEPDTLTELGQTLQLTATVRDQNNNAMTGVGVSWVSNNTEVVTVSETGLITAVGHGMAVIKASAGTVNGDIWIHVFLFTGTPYVMTITPTEPDTLTDVGQTLQLTATVREEDGNTLTDVGIAWESTNRLVATVDGTGLVTAVGEGSVSIIAEGGGIEAWGSVIVSFNGLRHDRDILTAFYYLTDGPNWSNDTNWLSEEPLSEWYGVETRNTGRVVELRLEENNLRGVIPADLARLTGLEGLRLRNNGALSGILPNELINLRVGTLHLGGTGVCAPANGALQAWLRGIPDRQVADCDPAAPFRAAAYLTQATQSFTHPVPLVAGERALLRVFVVADADAEEAAMPPVRATFYLDGAEVLEVDEPGGDASVPTRIYEGSLAASVNVEVPGNVIQPGLEMVIEIDPDGTLTSTPNIGSRLPETGRMTADVKDVPPMDLTLVPFLWEENPDRSVLTQIEGVAADSWHFRLTRTLLPVRDFRLTVRDHVWTEVDPVFDNVSELLRVIAMTRATDGASGHYMGILMSEGGLADMPGFHSLARFTPATMAHELGHNMNLGHAPCNVYSPGYYYPYQDGSTGSWGYDFDNIRFTGETLVSPRASDIMGYCFGNQWIGAYHFARALNYRHYHEGHPDLAGASLSSRSLLIWGGVDEQGEPHLEPAFLVDAPPSPLQPGGPYRLAGESAEGAALFSFYFEIPESVSDEGEGGGAFAFVLPMRPAWGRSLARVTLSGPGGVAELDGDGGRSAALLLDRVTGSVRGYLRDWHAPDGSAGAARRVVPEGLDVLISNGLPGPVPRDR